MHVHGWMFSVRGVRRGLRQRSRQRVPPVHERFQEGNVLGYCAGSSIRARRVGAFGGVPGEDGCYSN